jgi:hypothetical protein
MIELMNYLWNIKYKCNNAPKDTKHEEFLCYMAYKDLIAKVENYMLDTKIFATVQELEEAEFNATRTPVAPNTKA